MATIAEFLFEGAAGDGWTSSQGAIDTAEFAEGVQSIYFDCVGVAKQNQLTLGAGKRIITGRFYYRIKTDTSGSASIVQLDCGANTFVLQARTGRKLRVLFVGGTAGLESSVLNLNQWYLIDFRVNTSANPYAAVFKINGVDQPTAGRAVVAADMSNLRLGNTGGNTYQNYFDAFKVTDLAADYPLGPISQPLTLGLTTSTSAIYAPTVAGVAGPQSVGALALVDGANAIYAPTVAPQAVTAGALPLLDGSSAIYAPTLTPKNTLTVALLDGASAIYSPTLTPKNTLTVGLIDASSAIYALTVVPGAVTADLPLLDAGSAIYSPTVSPQAVTTGALPLLDGASAIYSPTIQAATVTFGPLDLLDGSNAVYAPTLTPLNAIDLALLDGGSAVYEPTLANLYTVTLGFLDAGNAIYAPTVLPQPVAITLPLLGGGAAYYDTVLADSPVGYWRLGEPSGTNANDEISANDGTYVNTPTLSATGLLTGDADTSVAFDLTQSEYVNLGNPAAFQLTTGTIEAWIKTPNAGSGYHAVIVKQYTYGLFLVSNVLGAYDWTAGALRSTGVNLADDVRHHVALSFQSGVTNGTVIYIDGVAVLTTLITTGGQAVPLLVAEGGTGAGQYFTGVIDEPAVYDYVLTPAQVAAHYDAGLGVGGSAIYAPTVIPGAASLTLPLLDGGAALYAPSLSLGISLGLLDGANAIYQPTLTPQNTLGPLDLLGGAAFQGDAFQGDAFEQLGYAIYALTVTSGALTLTLDLLEGAAAIYAPEIQPDQTADLPLLDGANDIYALAVEPGSVTASLSLIESASVIYDVTLLPISEGALPLLDGVAAIYDLTVLAGAVGIDLDLLDAGSAIYAPTLTTGAVTVELTLLDGVSAIYALSLTPVNAIGLDLLDGISATYAPTLTPVYTITLDPIDGVSAIYAPTITTGAVSIDLDLIDGASAIYQPTVTVGSVTASLDLIESASVIYDLSLQAITGGALPLIDGAAAIYQFTIEPQPVAADLDLIDAGSAIYDPTLAVGAVTISLPDLDAGRGIFAPLVLTTNDIDLAVLDGGSALYPPSLTQTGVPVLGLPLLDGGNAIYPPRIRIARRGGRATVPIGRPRDLIEEDDEEILIALLAT